MNPTLKVGDVLEAIPYEDRRILIGDVVVFHPPEGVRHVVHRVIACDSRGVRTRGDNNTKADPYVIPPSRIIGKVVTLQRGNKNIPIYGGNRGTISANVRWAAKKINSVFFKILHPAYHYLARQEIFKKVLPPCFKPRLVCFRRVNGVEMQVHMGGWVIGRRLAGQSHWHIRRPFRLLVDEALLTEENSI
jgi:signal peptidase I